VAVVVLVKFNVKKSFFLFLVYQTCFVDNGEILEVVIIAGVVELAFSMFFGQSGIVLIVEESINYIKF
jgi:hypothetical protein